MSRASFKPVGSLLAGALVTSAALWFLLDPETVGALETSFARANATALFLAGLIGAAVQWLRAWRFAVLTRGTLALPDARLVRIAFQLNLFNFVLPFRLGEASYPVLMRRAYGQPLWDAAGVLLAARAFDFCAMAAIFLASCAWLGLVPPGSGRAAALLGLALALAPVALAAGAPVIRTRMPALAARLQLDRRRPAALLAAYALTFAIWLVFGAVAMVAGSAVADMRPAVAMLGAAAGSLAFALPVNGIAGLGPAQAAWAAAVSWAGLGWPDAVASALAVYAVTLASALLFGGLATLGGLRIRRPAATPQPE